MNKYFFCILFLIICIISGSHFLSNSKNDKIIKKWAPQEDVVEMPIVKDSKSYKVSFKNSSPVPERNEKYFDLLSASVKIRANGASGSGTIFHYDHVENWAYIISCGHLWSGNYDYNPKNKIKKAQVITWYNEKKLKSEKTYEAEILFYSNERGYDCSCIRFKPDWRPNYYPIGFQDHKLTQGEELNSLGCDGGGEVARYGVHFLEYRGEDLITVDNSPRPGRSGGGLITDSGWFVAICWGTSDTISGNGVGYFTPLKSIHEIFNKNKLYHLLSNNEFNIPIYDRENPDKKYDWNFVPTPVKKILDFSFFNH
jgi:hypothetical protein